MYKIIDMVCQPGPIYGKQSASAYGKFMTGKGYYNRVRKYLRVVYEECGTELAATSMATYLQKQHGRSGQAMILLTPLHPYHVKLTTGGINADYHVNWLPGWGVPREGYQSPQLTAEFYASACGGCNNYPEQGKCPTPPVQAVRYALNPREIGDKTPHHQNVQEGAEKKHRCLDANYDQVATDTELWDRDNTIEKIDTFK